MPIHMTRANQTDLLSRAAELTDCHRWAHDAAALGMYDDAEKTSLRAVIVVENRTAYGADLHFAMEPGRRINRQIIAHMVLVLMTHAAGLRIPRLWAHIAASNAPTIALCVQCGFQFEYRKRGSAAGEEDAIVMSLDRDAVQADAASPSLEQSAA